MGGKRLVESRGRLLRHNTRTHSYNCRSGARLRAAARGDAHSGSARASRAGFGAPAETSAGVLYSKRHLPHFERPWGKYVVAFSTHKRRQLTPEERDVVLESTLHAHEHQQYELYAACVMPDHVHLLFEPQIKEQNTKGETLFLVVDGDSSGHQIVDVSPDQ